jgi:hypothetical protein
MSRGIPASTLFAVIALALAALGCSEKNAAATADAGAAARVAPDAGDGGAPAASSTPDAGVLEDTAMPASSGEDLQIRMRHLLEAIAQNNPDLAGDALFPRDAYVAARDVSDPQKAWEKRVSNGFRRSVERMHKRIKGAEHAKFVSFEVGHAVVQLTPKKKDFKRPLWRVKHSKLTFTIDGKTRHLDIPEMTAWRGAWYVTRLR